MADSAEAKKIVAEIDAIGGKVRELKAAKAEKAAVQIEVDKLLAAKAAYKTLTGADYKPPATTAAPAKAAKAAPAASSAPSSSPSSPEVQKVETEIEQIGSKIRELKGAKADKATVQVEVDQLLAAKAKYKSLTGSDYKPPAAGSAPAAKAVPVAAQKGGDAKVPASAAASAAAHVPSAPEPEVPRGLHFVPNATNKTENEKCWLVATLAKVDMLPASGEHVNAITQQAPVLPAIWDNTNNKSLNGTLIFGANAVCKYLAVKSEDKALRSSVGTVAMDDLFELESLVATNSTSAESIESLKQNLAAIEAQKEALITPLASHALYHSLSNAMTCLSSAAKKDASAAATSGASSSGAYANVSAVVKTISSSDALNTAKSAASLKLGSKKAQKAAAKAAGKGGKSDAAPTASFSTADVVRATGVDVSDWEGKCGGLMSALKTVFTATIAAAFPQTSTMTDAENAARITRCNNPAHGDYQCNNSLAISKALRSVEGYKGCVAPKDVAERIVAALPLNASVLIGQCSVAPNGFINIHLSSAALTSTVSSIASKGAKPPTMQPRKVLVDFSSPNIAKEMHVGHLRSTIIGDCVCRIFEFIGYETMRVNHVGDWGTQFGMLITYLQEAFPDILTNPPNITDLTVIYKESKKRFDEDQQFKETARLNVVKLQAGDPACRAIWNLLCDISRVEFQKVYDVLDVKVEEYGESYYNPMIPGCIEELKQKGLVIEEEKMLIVKLPHFTIPLIVQKSDGGYGYDSTDMAALQHRLHKLNRDWIVYITDAGQAPHFHMVFDAGKAAGWNDTAAAAAGTGAIEKRVDHIGFGVVCGDDGKRLKTRSGETIKLIDLLNEAPRRMEKELLQRAAEGKTPLSPEEIKQASQNIGYAAVKYADLKNHPTTNYTFSYDRMLDTKGDTAVYLMFAYARICSILRKGATGTGANGSEAGIDIVDLKKTSDTVAKIEHPAERALAMELMQMGDVLRSVANELMPNRLCAYLMELSVKCTDFVTKCHVLNALQADGKTMDVPTVKARLLLCESTRAVMEQCLNLLGINPLERI